MGRNKSVSGNPDDVIQKAGGGLYGLRIDRPESSAFYDEQTPSEHCTFQLL